MRDELQKDTDKLKQRAVHSSIAVFIQDLAEWGFDFVDHGYLWEAMCAVIEAGEQGRLDDLIACYEGDETDEYFRQKVERLFAPVPIGKVEVIEHDEP